MSLFCQSIKLCLRSGGFADTTAAQLGFDITGDEIEKVGNFSKSLDHKHFKLHGF
jgi:hypothetical protein